LTFTLTVIDKTTHNINQFYIQKALGAIAGKVRNDFCLRPEDFWLRSFNQKQAEALLKANLHIPYPIHVDRCTSPELL
jgi:hypothetical protein